MVLMTTETLRQLSHGLPGERMQSGVLDNRGQGGGASYTRVFSVPAVSERVWIRSVRCSCRYDCDKIDVQFTLRPPEAASLTGSPPRMRVHSCVHQRGASAAIS